MSAPSGDVYKAPEGMRIRLRRSATAPGRWIWKVLRAGSDRRGVFPTLGGGAIDPSWKRVEAAGAPAKS